MPRLTPTVDQLAVATDAIAASTGLAGMNPALATQASRLAALRATLDCNAHKAAAANGTGRGAEEEVEEPLPRSSHPTGMRFPAAVVGAQAGYRAAASVANVALIAVCGPVFVLCVVAPGRVLLRRALKGRPVTMAEYRESISWARFPGVAMLPAALLVPGTASAAVAVLALPATDTTGATPVARVLCGASLALVGAALAAGIVLYRLHFWRVFEAVPCVGAGSSGGASSPAMEESHRPLLSIVPTAGSEPATGEGDAHQHHQHAAVAVEEASVSVVPQRWTAADAPPSTKASLIAQRLVATADVEWHAVDRSQSKLLLRRFGILFEPYGRRAPWFFAAELGFSAAVAVVAALKDATGCAVVGWLGVALQAAFLALLLWLRPHAVALDRVLYPIIAAAQTTGAVLAAVVQQQEAYLAQLAADVPPAPPPSSDTRAAAEAVITATGMTLGVVAFYELAKQIYLQILQRQRLRAQRRSLERQSADLSRSEAALRLNIAAVERSQRAALHASMSVDRLLVPTPPPSPPPSPPPPPPVPVMGEALFAAHTMGASRVAQPMAFVALRNAGAVAAQRRPSATSSESSSGSASLFDDFGLPVPGGADVADSVPHHHAHHAAADDPPTDHSQLPALLLGVPVAASVGGRRHRPGGTQRLSLSRPADDVDEFLDGILL